ncbi:hypothetical protein WR25_02404 isoform B [Diploscapter pachys]|nr:hypothetical protein WR25_02404 isoform B [Diploscapter pachys]
MVLLSHLGKQKLSELVSAIRQAKRIDTLCSLKKLHDDGRLYSFKGHCMLLNQGAPSYSNALTAQFDSVFDGLDYSKALLVNHYETTDEERKEHKWLMKNLNKHCPKYDLKVLEVDELETDENRIQLLTNVFKRAQQIIFCFTTSYLDIIRRAESGNPVDNQIVQGRILLHSLADNEYYTNGLRNKRFRPIMMPGVKLQDLQKLWAGNTVIYSFPDQFKAMMERICKEDANLKLVNFEQTI